MGRHRKDGQPTEHGNRYTTGTVARERVDKVVAFKPKIEIAEALFKDMEARKLTPTQWLDMAVERVLLGDGEGRREESGSLPPVVQDALTTSIELKRAAIAREKKARKPDSDAIATWELQIEELEKFL